jgi:hypothetical protein
MMSRQLECPNRREVCRVVVVGLRRRRREGESVLRVLNPALGLALLVLTLGVSLMPTAASAAPVLAWSAPVPFDSGNVPSAVSCSSEVLCVAVDHQGNALSTSDPTASRPSWSSMAIDAGEALNAVSCVADGPCVAVDERGAAIVSSGSGASHWSPPSSIGGGSSLTDVSCASASLCVAVNAEGDALTSTNPGSGGWTTASIDPGHRLTGISCASQTLCVAVDDAGDVLASAQPDGGVAAWHSQRVAATQLLRVSCSVAGACVAVDMAGDALASSNPSAFGATWSDTPIDSEALSAISCASSEVCVATDARGQTLASDNPAASVPVWSMSSADLEAITGISCLSGGLCMSVDSSGRSLTGHLPAPTATTLAPTSVTDTGALLAGSVDPNDATLEACSFEYGTGIPYTQSVPCSAFPATTGGNQAISAQLSGLAPNTTYHYRALASGPAGVSVGADETFTTAVSSQVALVHPHPSITGTPAAGQRLTCHPGTPTGAVALLSYTWLRDLVPIAQATGSTYSVKGQDTGHHLQCQVTASDGGGSVTAKSAFVTVPAGGVPASVGETTVGKATFKQGKLSVPIVCSGEATGGCEVTVRLTVVETLSGRRVVAIAASSRHDGHARDGDASTAGSRRVTLTLASLRARLATGEHRTLTASLSTTGRRLLASRRRLSAYVAVSGTVIGVIEAQLARQLIALGGSSRVASARTIALLARPADTHASAAAARVLAATPYMGWDTYFALGGKYSEATILRQASELISRGLRAKGYRYVWLDVGWWHGTRAANGQITVSSTQWPHGLAWLARTLHAAGLLVGLYTDAGPNGCGGAGQGSYGHYQQDVNTFAAWGFDAVKVDFCGGAENGLNPASAYSAFHATIEANSSRRPMLLSICDFLQPEQYAEGQPPLGESAFSSYSFGPSVGNSWRTDTDVGFPGDVAFADVLRNMDADAANPSAAGPGHWNDPDYLAPDQGMSVAQFRSQLSMWAMLAAPLMISDDLTKIGPSSIAALKNAEMTAVDQDPGGVQATLLSSTGDGQVWVKPLIDGSRAVALLNRGSNPIKIETNAGTVGLPVSSSYALRNLWTHATSFTHGSIGAEVAPDSTVLLRVSAR